jgi:tetratricopeptide (TPR) repeat protein
MTMNACGIVTTWSRRIALGAMVSTLVCAATALGQSFDERVDDEQFLDRLVELQLPDALDHYIATHPPADEATAMRYALAADRMRLRAAATGAERLIIIERMLATRRAIIDADRTHPQLGVWLADQASDLYFELLPINASGVTSLYGAPSETQLQRAQRVAKQMHELAAWAEQEIDRAILDLEEREGFRDDPALQMRKRTLAREERDLRIPMLRGVGACLHALLNEQSPARRRALLEIAEDRLAGVEDQLAGVAQRRARICLGLVRTGLGRYDEAESLFRAVATAEDAGVRDAFSARMGAVRNLIAQDKLDAALQSLEVIEAKYESPEHVLYFVLIADQRYVLRRLMNDPEAHQAYLDLLDIKTHLSDDAMLAIVFEKLSLVAEGDADLTSAPALVQVAAADRMRQESTTRPRAIDLLEHLLARKGLDDRTRAIGIDILGRARFAAGDPVGAASAFRQLAIDHPADRRAEPAIEYAATLLYDALRKTPEDSMRRADLRNTLDILVTRFPSIPSVNRWRLIAGRTAMRDHDYAAAEAHFDAIAQSADEWFDGRFSRVHGWRTQMTAASGGARRAEFAERIVADTPHLLEGLSRAADTAAQPRCDDLRYSIIRLGVFHAEALYELARYEEALDALDAIGGQDEGDAAATARIIVLRVDINRALGRHDAARQAMRRLLSASPDDAPAVLKAMAIAALSDVDALLETERDDEALALAVDRLAPLAQLIEQWADQAPRDHPQRFELLSLAGDGLRAAGRFDESLAIYERLAQRRPDAAEVIFGAAECRFLKDDGDLARAMRAYKRIVASGEEIGRDLYWRSQVRMLEILERVDRNTEKIAPRIAMLRTEDPALGGPRTRRAFERLLSRHGR